MFADLYFQTGGMSRGVQSVGHETDSPQSY
jgi:hypothetical protein